jgi:hypothetical protein
MTEYRNLDAIMGPGAIVQLLDAFAMAPSGTVVECGIANDHDNRTLVLMRIGEGPRVAMTPSNARALAVYCLADELMPPAMRHGLADHLAGFARHLIALADEADAFAPKRLH